MLKICIIDDERKAAEILESMLSDLLDEKHELFIITDPLMAKDQIENINPQLVFLDIKMPGMSGFELLDSLEHRKFKVIFVTAYDRFAIQAIKKSALDYLLKPVTDEELYNAMLRFKQNQHSHDPDQIKQLLQKLAEHEGHSFQLPISNLGRTYFFELAKIVRCEAHSNYTYFYFNDGSKLLSSKTLKDHQDILIERGFLRIHKSHIINPLHIVSLIGRTKVEMLGGFTIPIARRRRNQVLNSILSSNP